MKGCTAILSLLATVCVSSAGGQGISWEDSETNSTGKRDGRTETMDPKKQDSEARPEPTYVTSVGVKGHRPLCVTAAGDEEDKIGCSVGNEILHALEMDDLITGGLRLVCPHESNEPAKTITTQVRWGFRWARREFYLSMIRLESSFYLLQNTGPI